MEIKTIIIDDEKTARDVLRNYLNKYCQQVSIIDEAANIKEGIALMEKWKPQLIFLDVEMPFGNAFDLLEATQHLDYQVVFVTAFSQYSLKALNMSASYYILKPIDIDELITAVQKVEESLLEKESFNRNAILLQNLQQPWESQQIILPTQQGFDVEKLSHILRLKANGNFTDIHFINKKKKLVCKFLKHFEDVLPSPFMRVHRSHIVNLKEVSSYHKSGVIMLSDGFEVEVSSAYKSDVLDYFKG